MAKTITKPRAKTSTKAVTKPATKATTRKPAGKSSAKPAAKSEAKPAAKSEARAAAKSEARAAAKPTTSTDTGANKTTASLAGIAKLLKQFELPGVDIAALIETQRKDIEALVAANRQAYEGMQSLAKRQTEILKETMEVWQTAAKELTGKSLSESAETRTELAKMALVKALSNMREFAEVATQSQAQVLGVIKKRALENLEDLKKLLQPK
jgi:phasin family protein